MVENIEVKCPITGAVVQILEIKHGSFSIKGYMGRVETPDGGYSTSIFDHREQVLDFFRQRNGVLKGKPLYNPPKIVIKDFVPGKSEADAALATEERTVDEEAQIGAERIARIVRG